jgi:hypothetical protein
MSHPLGQPPTSCARLNAFNGRLALSPQDVQRVKTLPATGPREATALSLEASTRGHIAVIHAMTVTEPAT